MDSDDGNPDLKESENTSNTVLLNEPTMRILFFSNVFPNPLQPAKGTFNASLIEALAKQHEVRVISPIAWTDELQARLRGAKKIERKAPHSWSRVPVDYPRYYYPPKILRTEYGRFLWHSVGRHLQRTIADFRPDAVVSYWTHPDGEVAVRAAREAGIPAITMVGGTDVLLLGKEGKRRRSILNVLNQADRVVTVSRDMARHLYRDGIAEDKVDVIYRGVDRSRFYPGDRREAQRKLGIAEDRPVLVSVGRLVPVKSWPVLIRACRLLTDRNFSFTCYVLGGGPQEKELKYCIDQNGLCGSVRLMGLQQQEQLADWYRAADLVVLPSVSEGVPNVLLEAMACGKSFVASDVGGIPEIADPCRDILVPVGNVSALADAVTTQLSQKENPETPRRFFPDSWESSAEKLVQTIQKRFRQKPSKRKTTQNLIQQPETFPNEVAACGKAD